MLKSAVNIIVMLVVLSTTGALAGEITVQIPGGNEKIGAETFGDIAYFSVSDLAGVLGHRISWDIPGLSAELTVNRHSVVFYINSPYVNLDDTVKNVTFPIEIKRGCIYAPIQTALPIIDVISPERIVWDNDRHLIRVSSEYYTITDMALSEKANGLLIELFVSEPKEFELYQSEGNWLNITIPDATVNSRQLISRKSSTFMRDMNVFQFEASSQISLRLRKPFGKITHRFTANPGRIQISLIDTTAMPVVSAGPDRVVGPDDHIDKVVIDAGHGGRDYGAIGLDGTQEKKIVLDIAKRLAKLIRKEKIFEVVMTRDKDDYVPLDERARIANESGGDVFISIHANASLKRSARGFQVFFLAPALNDEARAAAQLENAVFLSEQTAFGAHEGDDLSMILSDMIQNEFQEESSDFAAMVDREFRKDLSKHTRARGMDQAGFFVLNGVYMPSVLVESAFLTNEQDEKLLKSKDYRQDVAESIYAGLKRFKAKYENK
ncbi:MAG: N-acetylmuramoyl-L-alanine amidase [candidate division Zixibacteria bacterium]|nr:N-acetylmuramoyl-L-alanine amidase [candidate division Zixibacteria bacterium]